MTTEGWWRCGRNEGVLYHFWGRDRLCVMWFLYFLSVLDSDNCHCLCRSEIPPAGAPAGFDCAALFLCCARRRACPRRSAQDDTEGCSGREMYNSHSSCIERKSGTTHGSFPTKQTSRISRSKRPTPPSEARAGARGSASNPVWSLPSGGLLRARNFTARGNRIRST